MFGHMFYLKTECVALCVNQHGYYKKKLIIWKTTHYFLQRTGHQNIYIYVAFCPTFPQKFVPANA
jgi:hypothetical protein